MQKLFARRGRAASGFQRIQARAADKAEDKAPNGVSPCPVLAGTGTVARLWGVRANEACGHCPHEESFLCSWAVLVGGLSLSILGAEGQKQTAYLVLAPNPQPLNVRHRKPEPWELLVKLDRLLSKSCVAA